MTPGVVGDEGQSLVVDFEPALCVEVQGLCTGGQRLHGGGGYLGGAQGELRPTVDEHATDVEVVVGMLGTVDQRTALDTDHATVGLYVVVGTYGTWLHVKVNQNLVALFPFAVDGVVAVGGQLAGCRAVDRDGVLQVLAVGVPIEVAGHHVALQPSRYAYLQVEGACGILVDADGDITVPGVVSALAQAHPTAIDGQTALVGEEEVDVDATVADGIDIAGQRRNEATDVAGAAGTAEPGLALMLAGGLERVGVEEGLALE